MKPILQFFRTTLVGGLLFLLPIVVLVILIEKALALTHKFVEPLAARIPIESVLGLKTPLLLAISMVVLFCFFAGFFARTALARKITGGLEDTVLSKLPGYSFLKGLSESMLGVEGGKAFPVVLVRFDESWQIGFKVDVLENGLVAVLIPDAPQAQAGSIHYLATDRITPTDISLAKAMKCQQRFGEGSRALLRDLPRSGIDAAEAKRG